MAAYFLILGSLVSLLDVWAGATRDRREKQAAARRFPAGAVVVAAAACAVAILPFIGFLEALWSGTSWRWLGVIGLGAAVASAASLVVQRFAKAAPRDALQARLAILWAVILLLALLLQPFLSSQLSRVFVERLPTF
jgi:MFS family permease